MKINRKIEEQTVWEGFGIASSLAAFMQARTETEAEPSVKSLDRRLFVGNLLQIHGYLNRKEAKTGNIDENFLMKMREMHESIGEWN